MPDCFKSRIYLGIGSNLGDRRQNIIDAFEMLAGEISSLKTASLYRTEPLYNKDQPFFLNTVFYGFTSHTPEKLLDFINSIETGMGRDRSRSVYKGARIIDIDILLYDNIILDRENLKIPHAGMHERLFVLIPLAEISEKLHNPLTGELYTDIMKRLPKQDAAFFESCRYIENKHKKDIINAGNK